MTKQIRSLNALILPLERECEHNSMVRGSEAVSQMEG